jgi:hypothetical protein
MIKTLQYQLYWQVTFTVRIQYVIAKLYLGKGRGLNVYVSNEMSIMARERLIRENDNELIKLCQQHSLRICVIKFSICFGQELYVD